MIQVFFNTTFFKTSAFTEVCDLDIWIWSDKLLKEHRSDVYPANGVAAITPPVPSHFHGTEAKGVFSEAGGWFWSKSLVER